MSETRTRSISRGTAALVAAALVAGAALALCATPALAADGPADGEVRAAIERYFQNRLRRELQLSDDQVAAILPRIQAMEEARTAVRRQRAELVRDLRRGLNEGAADAELAGLLTKLEALELEQQTNERELLRSIDEGLSVRQRVQLRFFVEEFRRELQRRVRAIRAGRGPDDRPLRRPAGAGGRR